MQREEESGGNFAASPLRIEQQFCSCMIVMILKKKVNRQSKCNFFVTAFMEISDNIDIDSCHIIVFGGDWNA